MKHSAFDLNRDCVWLGEDDEVRKAPREHGSEPNATTQKRYEGFGYERISLKLFKTMYGDLPEEG